MESALRVRAAIDVGEYERYVIAKYFSVAATTETEKTRTRATRAQVRRFLNAAIRGAVDEQSALLLNRAQGAATRLKNPRGHVVPERLREPDEKQRRIAW